MQVEAVEPYTPWSNAVERDINELEKRQLLTGSLYYVQYCHIYCLICSLLTWGMKKHYP